MTNNILIAGVGNIFFRDDGFGVAVARELLTRDLPSCVTVQDFGIRGRDLAFELMTPRDLVIIADLVRTDEKPGVLTVIEPQIVTAENHTDIMFDGHSPDPFSVLQYVAALGIQPARTLIVGCAGEDLAEGIGLSEVVSAAVQPAADLILRLIAKHSQ